MLIDFEGLYAFLALYVPDSGLDLDHFLRLVSLVGQRRISVAFDKVSLPTAKQVAEVKSEHCGATLRFEVKFFGDTDTVWLSADKMPTSTRLIIYSETDLKQDQINILKASAKEFDYDLLFRTEAFRARRSMLEAPLAFISFDSKDRAIAREIASELQNMLCTVWYDEFSLEIGDSVRESIEKGLRECKKCLVILTPNYLENKGWAKTEFNSIFTRQLLFDEKVILPIWHNVTKQQIYKYSPYLPDVVALNWDSLEAAEICRRIFRKIMPLDK